MPKKQRRQNNESTRGYSGRDAAKKKRRKKTRWPAWKIAVISVLGLLIAIVAGLALYINHLLDGYNYEEEEVMRLAPTVEVTADDFGFVMPPPVLLDPDYTEGTPDSRTEEQPGTPGDPNDPEFVYVPVDDSDTGGTVSDTEPPVIDSGDTAAGNGSGETGTDSSSADGTKGNTAATEGTTIPPETLPPEELEKIVQDIKKNYDEPNPQARDGVTNILLIGVDSRSESIYGRSDTMVIATINHDKDKVVLSSLLRDTLAYIPGRGYSKLGHANAFGGPNLLVRTVRENFKIDIHKYALVNFSSMAQLVDSMGGVDIDVTAAELRHIPSGVRDFGSGFSGTKRVTLNGEQTVAYSRIRMIGTDFARTSRQRTVLEAMMTKLRTRNAAGLLSFAEQAFPLVTTNLTKGEFVSLAAQAPSILRYPVNQFRLPIDGSWVDKYHYEPNMLVIDYPRNLRALHDAIY